MKKHINILFLVFAILFFISSCKTEQQELMGSITGIVVVRDITGNMSPDAISTVNIAGITVNTNSSGAFLIENIPVGTYPILFKSLNTADYTKQSVQVFGGNKPANIGEVTLSEIPDANIYNLEADYNSDKIKAEITNNTNLDNLEVAMYVSLSADENVSSSNYDFYKHVTYYNFLDYFSYGIENLMFNHETDNQYISVVAYIVSDNNHDWMCDEYNMNCIDPTAKNPSNIIFVNLDELKK